MIELLLIIIVMVGLGVGAALPVLFPPIRKAAQSSPLIRIALMLGCALVSFCLLYGLIAELSIRIALVFYGITERPPGSDVPMPDPRVPELANAAARELWIREMIPSEGVCYTTPQECADADEVIALMRSPKGFADGPSAAMIAASLVPAVISMGTVWFLTLRNKSDRWSDAFKNLKEQDLYA